jgi:uncharacterized membrane protein YphA (DoxX/SURF4 family)
MTKERATVHFSYVEITATLVPSWMPFRTGLAYLTGFGQITRGLAMLFSILPRAAALIETGMLALFAFLVLGPRHLDNRTPKAGWNGTRSADFDFFRRLFHRWGRYRASEDN